MVYLVAPLTTIGSSYSVSKLSSSESYSSCALASAFFCLTSSIGMWSQVMTRNTTSVTGISLVGVRNSSNLRLLHRSKHDSKSAFSSCKSLE